MIIHFVRAVYLLVALALTTSYALRGEVYEKGLQYVTLYILIPTLSAFALVMVDMFWRRKHLQVLTGLFFGLLAGLVIAWGLAQVAEFTGKVFISPQDSARTSEEARRDRPINVTVYLTTQPTGQVQAVRADTGPDVAPPASNDKPITELGDPAVSLARVLLGVSAVFLCVSFVLQTKDDFRFIIPYVEFAKETKGSRPILLDTSVIIDGRIADIADTKILDSKVIVPRFILDELQTVADSSDKLKRNRGRRGLDILNRLRESKQIDLQVLDIHVTEVEQVAEIDAKLMALAGHLDGRVVTNDYNMNKIAQLRGIEVININDLANAMKPVVLPGETMTVKIIRPGEEIGQGVGYLDDGTMIVVEQASKSVGKNVTIAVTSVLQTSAGRMIFGKSSEKTSGNNS